MKTSVILLFTTLGLVLVGCGSDSRGERFALTGTVTFDGQPLSRATIVFVSGEGSGSVKASGQVEDGVFSIDAGRGALIGEARVEVYPELVELEEFEAARGEDFSNPTEAKTIDIPTRYNTESELTAIVKADGNNDYGFHLVSK